MGEEASATAPSQRRLIIVATQQRLQQLLEGPTRNRSIFVVGVGVAGALLAIAVAPVAAPLAGLAIVAGRRLLDPSIPTLPRYEPGLAERLFTFDTAALEDGAVYALSPLKPNHYILAHRINERLAQEKVAAFLALARKLGAARVEVVSREAVDRDVAAEAKLDELGKAVGFGAKMSTADSAERSIVATFSKLNSAPTIADEAAPWMDEEPTWREMAAAALDGNAKDYRVRLALSAVVDIDMSITSKLAKVGFKVGGEYRTVVRSVWTCDVHF